METTIIAPNHNIHYELAAPSSRDITVAFTSPPRIDNKSLTFKGLDDISFVPLQHNQSWVTYSLINLDV